MEQNLSLSVHPLWVVPYSTVALDYQGLLVEYDGYVQVGVCYVHAASTIPVLLLPALRKAFMAIS